MFAVILVLMIACYAFTLACKILGNPIKVDAIITVLLISAVVCDRYDISVWIVVIVAIMIAYAIYWGTMKSKIFSVISIVGFSLFWTVALGEFAYDVMDLSNSKVITNIILFIIIALLHGAEWTKAQEKLEASQVETKQ